MIPEKSNTLPPSQRNLISRCIINLFFMSSYHQPLRCESCEMYYNNRFIQFTGKYLHLEQSLRENHFDLVLKTWFSQLSLQEQILSNLLMISRHYLINPKLTNTIMDDRFLICLSYYNRLQLFSNGLLLVQQRSF